jgi:hypothetical protein
MCWCVGHLCVDGRMIESYSSQNYFITCNHKCYRLLSLLLLLLLFSLIEFITEVQSVSYTKFIGYKLKVSRLHAVILDL